ncbi:MAG: substrate-binding domain-containing protein [Kiritimatiellae bacterium]|jgi:phosphate transport system substrate-binding protein|nr:substrate-binding domain-containing protein [Kiritimatiellia bacterium]
MNNQSALKLIGLLMMMALTLVVGYVLLIITVFIGGAKFYTPLVMAATGGLLIFETLCTYVKKGRERLNRIFKGFIAVCLLSVLARMGYQRYHSGIEVVDTEVDIQTYAPFRADTLLVSLKEPATVRLQENPLRLDGATALYPVYAAFVQATYPPEKYNPHNGDVMCSKTGRAYDRLLQGEADMIFVAKPSQAHLDLAAEMGLEITLTPIGREAFVFFVHQQNDVRGLRKEDIQSIYSGEVTNWRELGGADQKIRPFQRPENSGSQTLLQSLMKEKTLMEPPTEDVVGGMGGIINRTANYRNYRGAIGYSFRFFASDMVQEGEIRLLEVDGIPPTPDTIADETYPLSTNIYAATAGSHNPNVDRFLEWILSKQGQEIIQRTGYTPISR